MSQFLPKVKGVEYFFKQPYIYLWLVLFLVFTHLVFSGSLATIYFLMISGCLLLFAFLRGTKFSHIGINSASGDSLKSLLRAGIAWVIFMMISIFILGIFGDAFALSLTFADFFKQNSIAFLGASVRPILAQSKILSYTIFSWVIPIIETILAGLLTLWLLVIVESTNIVNFRIGTGKFGLLKQPWFWTIAMGVATFVTWLHVQAKGWDSVVTLMMVFAFFLLTILLFSIPWGGKYRELETVIYLHIINNSVAVLTALGILGAWGII